MAGRSLFHAMPFPWRSQTIDASAQVMNQYLDHETEFPHPRLKCHGGKHAKD
jgi:hypothetical protein